MFSYVYLYYFCLLWPKSMTWGSHFCLSCVRNPWNGEHIFVSCNWSQWHMDHIFVSHVTKVCDMGEHIFICILFYLSPFIFPSVQDIFRHIFLSNCWWQKSDIWSQVSYRYTILWVAFFGLVRFLLPVCRLSWFLYTLNIYAHFSSHFSQQLSMAEIWYLVTSFI